MGSLRAATQDQPMTPSSQYALASMHLLRQTKEDTTAFLALTGLLESFFTHSAGYRILKRPDHNLSFSSYSKTRTSLTRLRILPHEDSVQSCPASASKVEVRGLQETMVLSEAERREGLPECTFWRCAAIDPQVRV